MSLGSVTVNNLNLMQGTPTEIERVYLFVGTLADGLNDAGRGQVVPINSQSDLDTLLGSGDSALKSNVLAARANGGQNWFGYLLPLSAANDLHGSIDAACAANSVEGVVLTDAIAVKADFDALQTMANNILNTYQRRVHVLACVAGCDTDPTTGENWAEYVARTNALTAAVAAERVCPVPQLYPDFLGALAGRLCNRAVTVADTPMRVATGSLIGSYATRPVDNAGKPLDKATLKALHNTGRFCVPTWYEDFDGTYTSDASTLAPVTSDYKVLEHLRVVDKAARAVYQLLVARVGNRRLNSTPGSIARHQTYFSKPLRAMSHSTQIGEQVFPGEVKPPQEGDVVIAWPTREKVEVFIKTRPYNCPKELVANIFLDLTNPGA